MVVCYGFIDFSVIKTYIQDCFVLDQHAELDFYSASSLKQQSPRVDMSLHSDTLFRFRANQSVSFSLMLRAYRRKQQALNSGYTQDYQSWLFIDIMSQN
jgi:hypothetical protein